MSEQLPVPEREQDRLYRRGMQYLERAEKDARIDQATMEATIATAYFTAVLAQKALKER